VLEAKTEGEKTEGTNVVGVGKVVWWGLALLGTIRENGLEFREADSFYFPCDDSWYLCRRDDERLLRWYVWVELLNGCVNWRDEAVGETSLLGRPRWKNREDILWCFTSVGWGQTIQPAVLENCGEGVDESWPAPVRGERGVAFVGEVEDGACEGDIVED
jgi:hypothetical protein